MAPFFVDELREDAVVGAEQATLEVLEIVAGRITTINVTLQNVLGVERSRPDEG